MAVEEQLRIDAAGTVPTETIRAFAAWDGHGCSAATHRMYVRLVQQVFAEGVATLGLWPQSTLAEAVQQLKGCRMDSRGFFRASLKKLILFLAGSGGPHCSGASTGSDQSTTKPSVKKRPVTVTAPLPAPKTLRVSGTGTPSPRSPRTADRLMPTLEHLLRWIASHEDAAPFRAPVSELYTSAQIPGYDSRVTRRMDLRTVGQKLARQEYRDAGVEQFRADVCLCFQNCISYVPNPADPFFRRALSCLKRFESRFAQRMSEIHTTAQGGSPIDEQDRRRPASREQRRLLRAAARRGGVVLLPFVAVSDYYSPDPSLVCMLAITAHTQHFKTKLCRLSTLLNILTC